MENKSHAFAAGLFTIVLSLVIISAIFWFRRDTTVRVPYDVVTTGSVTGLSPNAVVRYRGLPVGRVERIAFDPVNPDNIVIRIRVNEETPITRSTEARLGLQGVTGMAFLQLDERGTDKAALPSTLAHVAVIHMRPGMLEQLQGRGEALLVQVETLTRSLQKMTDSDVRQQILATAASIQHAADGMHELARRAGPGIDQVPKTLKQLDRTLASTNQLVANLNRPDGPLIGNLNRLGQATERAGVAIDEMSARVGYDTLPRVNALADDVRVTSRSLSRAADTISTHPRSLLFGAPPAPAGPGEPGFDWQAGSASDATGRTAPMTAPMTTPMPAPTRSPSETPVAAQRVSK